MDKELIDFLVAVRNELDQLIRKFTPKTLEQLKEAIPKELVDILTFEEKEGCFIVQPKGYLGSENFVKLLDCIKQFGGEYVSAGKNSHFRVLKGA